MPRQRIFFGFPSCAWVDYPACQSFGIYPGRQARQIHKYFLLCSQLQDFYVGYDHKPAAFPVLNDLNCGGLSHNNGSHSNGYSLRHAPLLCPNCERRTAFETPSKYFHHLPRMSSSLLASLRLWYLRKPALLDH